MTQRKVTRFTCDVTTTDCTDFLDVPSLTNAGAIVDAVEHGWTIDVGMAGEDPTHYCPVHKSHSGWDHQAEYPTQLQDSGLTADDLP